MIGTLISALVVLWIINKSDNPAYKLAWIIPILIFNIARWRSLSYIRK